MPGVIEQRLAVSLLAGHPTRSFAACPSGTESIYKIYAESFRDEAHLEAIVIEAPAIVNKSLGS